VAEDYEDEEYDHSRAKEDARNAALGKAGMVTVLIENTYSCGRVSHKLGELPEPTGQPDDEWWDKVWGYTGDGHQCGESDNALYEAKIIVAVARPELVGLSREWGG
jgi:hypothetical protein